MEQRDIKSLTLEELKGELQAHGEKAFRAGQIYNWMHGKLASGFDEMSNLSKSLRELLKNEYEYTNLEIVEVRLGLEELAVKLACQRITESELQKLYQASRSFEQMLETTETDDLQKLAQADVAFHDVIYQATNNERLIQLLNNLREQMYRYRIEYLKDVKSRRSLVEEHDALYERMKNRDLAGAQKMIREHIERQQESIMQTVHHQSMTGVEEK